jgi:hypothetical protein
MTDPAAPPAWVLGLIMGAGVSSFIGLLFLIRGIKRAARWLSGDSDNAPDPRSRMRSTALKSRFARSNRVRTGSRGVNATLRHQDGTFAGSEGSRSGSQVRTETPTPAATAPTIETDLPQNIEELAWAIEAVRLRTSGEEPTKEAAIIRAFPHVNSKGGGAWQRASLIYETVSRAQKTSQPAAREVETA